MRKTRETIGIDAFKSLYVIYLFIFRWFAGTKIDFGNFCYIPYSTLNGIAHSPSPGCDSGSLQLPLQRISTERGCRYAGKSAINLSTLVVHGLSAVSVYSDIVLVRLMIAMFGVSAMTVSVSRLSSPSGCSAILRSRAGR